MYCHINWATSTAGATFMISTSTNLSRRGYIYLLFASKIIRLRYRVCGKLRVLVQCSGIRYTLATLLQLYRVKPFNHLPREPYRKYYKYSWKNDFLRSFNDCQSILYLTTMVPVHKQYSLIDRLHYRGENSKYSKRVLVLLYSVIIISDWNGKTFVL